MNNPYNIQVGDEVTLLIDGEYAWHVFDPLTGVREPSWFKIREVNEKFGSFVLAGCNWRLDPKKYYGSWEWVKKVVQYKVDQEVDDDEELL
ncbi:hypothetical protein SmphiM6_89 [Sinorhizobium phage phiM6]|nr:hypothetical protein SmphiM6_89 [Sinorhizobium phage phiM6]